MSRWTVMANNLALVQEIEFKSRSNTFNCLMFLVVYSRMMLGPVGTVSRIVKVVEYCLTVSVLT
jgi:hypothetical protein